MTQSDKEFILVYGDAFVDYIANDATNTSFTTFLGGATINVAAGISRIGAPSALITITGEDDTSEFVRQEIKKEGVNLDYSVFVPEKRVSGVYVHLTENGERIFKDYIDEAPDLQVTMEQLNKEAFKRASVFNCCSGTMFHPTALETTRVAVEMAKQQGALVAIDANIRILRWSSEQYCRETIASFFQDADILKLTDEELLFLTETNSIEAGLEILKPFNIPVILITVGAEGAYAVLNGVVMHVPVEKVIAVDTTGAGDAFMAGVLRYVHYNGMPLTDTSLFECVSFGNKLGAIAATKPGALTALPHYEDIKALV
ncbi:carbohydrate kinase family protein [Lysinibacillus odysseyi]|uniref:Fructokinase n=1 Tax=Lysinibacillus odysseyi 34hs-1 = NBRC 100172 TaxID=1220589 RepID=A0A0A3IUS9_9BACI|nr:carbohydrate kinase [Lysinibacillus odysseyi]KGR87190.1 fructokinase [Lysinibacillus odysseyi 34hs-1 = NBRC 100172]